jgi:hypothetical protein
MYGINEHVLASATIRSSLLTYAGHSSLNFSRTQLSRKVRKCGDPSRLPSANVPNTHCTVSYTLLISHLVQVYKRSLLASSRTINQLSISRTVTYFRPTIPKIHPLNTMSSFNLFNEFRPLFLLLDQPSASARGSSRGFNSHFGRFAGPAVEFAEVEGKYIVEAELPGVKKEDPKVTIEEGGSALTIVGSRV